MDHKKFIKLAAYIILAIFFVTTFAISDTLFPDKKGGAWGSNGYYSPDRSGGLWGISAYLIIL